MSTPWFSCRHRHPTHQNSNNEHTNQRATGVIVPVVCVRESCVVRPCRVRRVTYEVACGCGSLRPPRAVCVTISARTRKQEPTENKCQRLKLRQETLQWQSDPHHVGFIRELSSYLSLRSSLFLPQKWTEPGSVSWWASEPALCEERDRDRKLHIWVLRSKCHALTPLVSQPASIPR